MVRACGGRPSQQNDAGGSAEKTERYFLVKGLADGVPSPGHRPPHESAGRHDPATGPAAAPRR